MMEMPANVYATLDAMVQKYPHIGNDEARRVAMEKAVATIRQRHGPRWVWKTEHQSLIAPSKDGLGYVPEGEAVHGQLATMFIWDTINGSSRQLHPAPLQSTKDSPRQAYVIAVPPKDWLGGDVPVAPDPPTQTSDLLRRIGELVQQIKELEERVSAASLDAIDAREFAQQIHERLAGLTVTGTVNVPVVVDGFRARAKGDVTLTVRE